MAEKDQLAVSYAAFILSGQGADVTSDSLNAVLSAAGLPSNATLVNAVAKALKKR
jgi:ribosomal protein L12E/L44/L45/RPP1/RPP2